MLAAARDFGIQKELKSAAKESLSVALQRGNALALLRRDRGDPSLEELDRSEITIYNNTQGLICTRCFQTPRCEGVLDDGDAHSFDSCFALVDDSTTRRKVLN